MLQLPSPTQFLPVTTACSKMVVASNPHYHYLKALLPQCGRRAFSLSWRGSSSGKLLTCSNTDAAQKPARPDN